MTMISQPSDAHARILDELKLAGQGYHRDGAHVGFRIACEAVAKGLGVDPKQFLREVGFDE